MNGVIVNRLTHSLSKETEHEVVINMMNGTEVKELDGDDNVDFERCEP